jgi:hypothetical protein
VHELSREQYRAFRYQFVDLFVEHLADVSSAFGGDLQEMLVLAIVGQVRIRAVEMGRETAPISASRISDVTAIPRQTVRRKLQSLERRGWVRQIVGGGWELIMADGEAVAQAGLKELDGRGIERAIKFVRNMREIV